MEDKLIVAVGALPLNVSTVQRLSKLAQARRLVSEAVELHAKFFMTCVSFFVVAFWQ